MNSGKAAFFDVDGTIIRGNIVAYYAFIRMHSMERWRRKLWLARFIPRIPLYYLVDKVSRRWFSLLFYRNYRHIPPPELRRRAQAHFEQVWSANIYPKALERIRHHQEQGDDIVLVSGSLEVIIEPLARRIGNCRTVAGRLDVVNGSFSGRLMGGPLTGEGKAKAVQQHAARFGVDLDQSFAYADSVDDIPMLRSVGVASVVNPSRRLRKVAAREGWSILNWKVDD